MRNQTFKTDIKLKFNEYMKTIAAQNSDTFPGRLFIVMNARRRWNTIGLSYFWSIQKTF